MNLTAEQRRRMLMGSNPKEEEENKMTSLQEKAKKICDVFKANNKFYQDQQSLLITVGDWTKYKVLNTDTHLTSNCCLWLYDQRPNKDWAIDTHQGEHVISHKSEFITRSLIKLEMGGHESSFADCLEYIADQAIKEKEIPDWVTNPKEGMEIKAPSSGAVLQYFTNHDDGFWVSIERRKMWDKSEIQENWQNWEFVE